MNWYWKVWCRDCCGEDSQGCFGGESEIHGPFANKESAETNQSRHEEKFNCSLWEYEVYQE